MQTDPFDGVQEINPKAHAPSTGYILVKMVDANEATVYDTVKMKSENRTVNIQHQGATFTAARQEPDGTWIYRLNPK